MSNDSFKKDVATMERLALFVSIVGVLSALAVVVYAALEIA